MNKKLICMDLKSARNPEACGIDANAVAQTCCQIETNGEKAREVARTFSEFSEVYIISCEEIDAINLAAAIKSDRPSLQVNLVVSTISGSLKSRAEACGVDRVINLVELSSFLGQASNEEGESTSRVGKHQYFSPDDLDVDEPSYISAEWIEPEPIKRNCCVSHANSECWIMSIFSGSGGAGKSTISAISAQLLSSLGYKTLLIDCDLQFGDLRNAFKNANCASIEQVVQHPEKMEPLCELGSEGLCILQAPRSLESFEVVAPKINELLFKSSQIFDVIVINTGSCWSDVHANLMKLSSLSLFLIDQRVSSVRGCKHALELAERLNISSQSFKFALNRCCKKSVLSVADVQPTFGCNDVFELADGSLEVEEKMCLGAVMDLVKQKNPLTTSILEMLKIACPLRVVQRRKHERSHENWRCS